MRTEDGYIIDKCLKGNSAAFGFLVDKYKTSVYAFAYSELRNFHDAEDVTQEVFVKAYQKLRTLRRWDNFLAWLYSITSNLCKMHVRAKSRRPDREFIEDQNTEALEEPTTEQHRESPVEAMLHEALNSLPKSYRQVLALYYLGDMDSVEIARFLGMSPAAVRQRLTRARSQLKEGMLAMMGMTFEEKKLHETFTFRIVEAVKRIKIQPTPRAAGLPWGLSLAAGVVLTAMSIGPHLSLFSPMSIANVPALSSVEEYDPETDTWTKKKDMPKPIGTLSAGVANDKIYITGGYDNKVLATVAEYDPATDVWTEKKDMPTARNGHCTEALDGKIYVIGGLLKDDVTATSITEQYDPATDTWTKKEGMKTNRALVASSMVDGKIYVIGGIQVWPVMLSTVEEYIPEGLQTVFPKDKLPTKWGEMKRSALISPPRQPERYR